MDPPWPRYIIKMNVDATWVGGKSSIVVVAQNYQGEVLGLWFENLECTSHFTIELLAIKKACNVSATFPSKEIQIESNCKVAIESLWEFAFVRGRP